MKKPQKSLGKKAAASAMKKKKPPVSANQWSIECAAMEILQTHIQNSEWLLIEFLIKKGKWKGTKPQKPSNYDPQSASIEIGLMAWWLNNLYDSGFSWTVIGIGVELRNKWQDNCPDTWPKSKMTYDNFKYVTDNGGDLVYDDGSVLSGEPYATYDTGWFSAFLNLMDTVITDRWKFGQSYPPVTATLQALRGSSAYQLTIGLLGDWGTGTSVPQSVSVMNSLVGRNPDYLIHLGDVYYSGTPSRSSWSSLLYLNANEELDNLVNIWPPNYAGRSFTLNSNHEMYTGAYGLFDDALNLTSPFKAQQGQGCFALKVKDWTIIGLDSAYNGHFSDGFMSGNIGDENGTIVAWIKKIAQQIDTRKTIIMTHHNGFEYDASLLDPIWNQVKNALGNDPYAWYWGHIHNAIVYRQPPFTIPVKPNDTKNEQTIQTFARCVGHSAIPYGEASLLNGHPLIRWVENNKIGNSNQLHNGYAMLTFKFANDKVSEISEAFFDTSRQPQPVFGTTIFPVM